MEASSNHYHHNKDHHNGKKSKRNKQIKSKNEIKLEKKKRLALFGSIASGKIFKDDE